MFEKFTLKDKKYAEIIVDIPPHEVDHPFEYLIPVELSSRICVGSMVLVPFGPSLKIGYVVGFKSKFTLSHLSSIMDILDETPVFSEEMVKLCQWIADHYLCTLGEALKLAFPPGRGRKLSQEIILNGKLVDLLKQISPTASRQREILRKIAVLGGKVSLRALKKSCGGKISSALKELEGKKLILKKYWISQPKVDIKKERYIRLNLSSQEAETVARSLTTKAPKQQRILEVLSEELRMPVHELLSLVDASYTSLKSLVDKGFVRIFDHPTFRDADFYYPENFQTPSTLTCEQAEALQRITESIDGEMPSVFLLQGITGSGKTEIYLQAISHILKKGKTAIVLVPEIALTPQTVHRFRSRFGEIVAILHSGLGLGERFDQWRRVKEGRYKVVVGARSALFAPVSNLGLIVVDEEHESTYKQNRNPRYHARDVALKRAQLNNACVILGSATPSVESKFKAERGEYELIYLTRRIENRPLPGIQLVDMRREINKGIFSSTLRERMNECINSKGKMILFLNRRGYCGFLLCRDCGLVIKCKRCAVSLTYHQDKRVLKCHHCGYVRPAPCVCPKCKGHRIRYLGIGTQRVESELKLLFPHLPIIRMDADTTVRRGAHRRRLIEFKEERVGVLLGTQMIAKGLDFPEVTLVGIINADTALNLPDFRAAERTFQLLMQVGGRAGRGQRPGTVIVQTYCPENYAIQAVLRGNYDSFYLKEISLRKELKYPPFCELINILISARDEGRAREVALSIGRFLQSKLDGLFDLLGPAPAPLQKLGNKYRWHIVLKVSNPRAVKTFLKENHKRLLPEKYSKDVTLFIDVDPVWLL